MTTLFSAKYDSDESDEDIESFSLDFDDVDDLVEIVDDIEEKVDFFDRDDVEITINDAGDDNEIVWFLNQFDEITMDILVDTYFGDYDDFVEEGGDYYWQFMYLTKYNSQDAETAMDNASNVMVYHGTAEEYVEQFTKDCHGEIPTNLKFYINWEKMASDFVRDGELLELDDIANGTDVWVTNGNSM